jgi:hypothetical protein
MTRSTIIGLEGARFKALPFQANSSDVELSATFTMQPEIEAAFEVGVGQNAGVGIFINPHIQVNASQRSSSAFDMKCNAASGAQLLSDSLQKIYPNLTLLAPEAGVGLVVEANVGNILETSKTFLAAKTPLPTQCLAYNQKNAAKGNPFGAAESAGVVQKGQAVARQEPGELGSMGIVVFIVTTIISLAAL